MSLKTAASAENAVVNNIMTPIEKKVLITKWEVMLAVLVLVSPNPQLLDSIEEENLRPAGLFFPF